VENILDILRSGIDSAVPGLGHSSIHQLNPQDLLIPPGFDRGLPALSATRRPVLLNDA
jgi:hypothetical protein